MAADIRILHVDDEPEFAEMAATFLARENDRFTVETATSAVDGLERLSGGRFDCVVSDYDMPGRNGIEFLETVREEHPDLPFILFTGKGSEEVASDAISAGVTDYLQKESGTDQYTVLANRIRNAVERRRTERERDRQLEAIETAQEGISILDEDGRYIYVNQRFADLHGYDPEEMIGERWKLAYRDDDIPEVREEILPVVEETGYWHGETTSLRSDGTTVPVDHTLATTDRGELVCTVRDVSDRKKRERELRWKTARLEVLFEESPDMINVHDTDGNLIEPNPRLCEKTGYDAAELADMKVWELDRAIDPDEARALWEGMEVGDSRRLEGVYRRRDGSTFPVEVHVRRLRLEGEDRFIAIARDITDRKGRERKLELVETVFEHARECQFITEVAGGEFELRYANEYYKRTVGLPPDEPAAGQTPAELFGETAGREILDRYRECVETRESVAYTVEMPVPEEGTVYRTILTPVVHGGEVTHVVGTARDVTDRKRRERELERQNERLEEFASVVSHDLRNPLNVATGSLRLAREECDSEHLECAKRALSRADVLIEELLALAREEEGVADLEPVDLATVVEQCWANVETGDATLVADADRTIRADGSRLKRLFENLVRNAVEHGGDDVTVTVGELDDGFYVEDDGPGIAEGEREAVFDAGHSTSAEGTGFGLSIVSRIVDAHGWEVGVTGGAEGGARFEITGVEFAAG